MEEVRTFKPSFDDVTGDWHDLAFGLRGVTMEVFRDMLIRGDNEQVAALMDALEASLPVGWLRDRTIEGKLRNLARRTKPTYSFVHNREDRFASAT
jgi:hypothetical protein